jgi:hypothetical protein
MYILKYFEPNYIDDGYIQDIIRYPYYKIIVVYDDITSVINNISNNNITVSLISHNNITVKYITDAGITVKDKI